MHESDMSSRLSGKVFTKPAGWALLAFFLLIPANLFGQTASPTTSDEKAKFFANVGSAYQFKANMDNGGDVSITRYGMEVGGSTSLTDKAGISGRIGYARDEYNFSQTNGLQVQKPWGQINHLNLSARLNYKLTKEWSISAGPVLQEAGEDGAKFGDSLIYGGTLAAVYQDNPNFMIGVGAGVFYRLEETKVFPSLIISWNITDRLRLGNAYRLGPAGPAGLELSYKLDENWVVAAGGGHRSSRFRLDKSGSTPEGIGENRSWPVYARIGRKLGSMFYLDLYGGAAFGGKMTLNDRSGNEIRSVDYNTAPLVGASLQAHF